MEACQANRSAQAIITAMLSDQSPDTSVLFVVFTTLLLVLSCIGAAVRRRWRAGPLFEARCANPRHGIMKSKDNAELCTVRPATLKAIRGTTSRRQKVCLDCIRKLACKPEYRHLFHSEVSFFCK